MKFPTGFTYRNLHGFARLPGDSTALVFKVFSICLCNSVTKVSNDNVDSYGAFKKPLMRGSLYFCGVAFGSDCIVCYHRARVGNSLSGHDGYAFSTFDMDNDIYAGQCAVNFNGAWWYNSCHSSNLNGLYLYGPHQSYANGVNWSQWRGYHYSLKSTEMKIRPRALGLPVAP